MSEIEQPRTVRKTQKVGRVVSDKMTKTVVEAAAEVAIERVVPCFRPVRAARTRPA